MRKSVIISIVYLPTTPAFSHPSFPEGGEWRYHRLVKLPPNLKKNLKAKNNFHDSHSFCYYAGILINKYDISFRTPVSIILSS